MLTIKNKTEVAEIYISGDIVDDDEGGWLSDWRDNTTGYEFPAKLREQLNAIGKETPLDVHINSCGGSVFAGVAMANFIKNHKGKTTAIIDGIAASIASQIFFSADECKMPSNAYLMLHKPYTRLEGNSDELRKAAEILDTLQSGLESTYNEKACIGITEDYIHKIVNDETWLTGTEAVEIFKIKLLKPVETLNAVGNVNKLKARGIKIPDALNFLEETAPMNGAQNYIQQVFERMEGMKIVC